MSETEETPPARWRVEGAWIRSPEGPAVAHVENVEARDRILATLNETEALRERLRLAEAVCEAIRDRDPENPFWAMSDVAWDAYDAWAGAGAAPQDGAPADTT